MMKWQRNDENTLEVKSSPVVKVQKGSEWVSTPKRNQKQRSISSMKYWTNYKNKDNEKNN